MNYKLTNKIFAALVFVISLAQFLMTVQPSVSFWDCGEFIAAGYALQVPHPPGAPFFLLLGRIFSMIPFGANIAFRFNMISVLSSAISVLMLYLVAVKLIKNYRGREFRSSFEAIATFAASAIGALSFSFSDTFWFNGVEAEVYANSTFLFAVITWLMMVWHERADEPDNEKYLLMIAYLVGLSTGVHLMSVLAIVPVVMVILFRKYVVDDEHCKKTGYIFLGHAAILFIVALALWAAEKTTTSPSPAEYQAFDSKFKWIMVAISAIIMGAFWKKVFNRNSFYMPLIVGGIALMVTYPGVVKMLPSLILTVGGNHSMVDMAVFFVILALLGAGIYWSVKNNKPTTNLALMSLLFVVLGFTTYTMVIIRANQQPPMNENEPNDFKELVSYLNREQYGDFPTFKRRFATEPGQMVVYQNYSSDLDFFWRYQMNHMKTRYLLWNYAGRESWVQDSGVDVGFLNGIGNATVGKIFNIRFSSDGKGAANYLAIPFLLGLLGIYFQFKRDWKMASVFMIMFIFMGYLTAFYQNQQEPQPRERDYFYVGAFFVFSIWIALGIKGLVETIEEYVKEKSLAGIAGYAVLVLGFVSVPVTMASANWYTHDRSNNWVPWDYSYNLLQSCEPNAILFTNGDNDTFPLWYLQDVEGVRRDVRIVNLSLLNTNWYIKQLKHTEPYGSQKVALSSTDDYIETIEPMQWDPKVLSIPVPQEILSPYLVKGADGKTAVEKFGMLDSNIVRTGKLVFRMDNTLAFGDVKAIRTQDIIVRDIVESNNWKRPIYFAVTVADDGKIGLQDHLLMEGLAYKLVPFKRRPNTEFMNGEVMRAQLFNENPSYSITYKPGFKFRGLNSTETFFDENHERLTQNYRSSFMRLAVFYLYNMRDNRQCISALDQMEKTMPRKIIDMPYPLRFEISGLYYQAGAIDKYRVIAKEVETIALAQLNKNPNDVNGYYNPYRVLSEVYSNLRQYSKAAALFQRLKQMYPNETSIDREIARYNALASGKQDTSAGQQK